MSRADLAAQLLKAAAQETGPRREVILRAANVLDRDVSHEDLARETIAAGHAYAAACEVNAADGEDEDPANSAQIRSGAVWSGAETRCLAALLRGQAELLRLARGGAS